MKALVEAEGYCVTRAAGSKGLWDLIAYARGPLEPHTPWFRCIQVKANCKPSKNEIEEIKMACVPPMTSKEVWILRDRQEPEIKYFGRE